MDTGKVPINIHLDLSKAFDTLDHGILFDKLNYDCIQGAANHLFHSYTYQTDINMLSIMGQYLQLKMLIQVCHKVQYYDCYYFYSM